MEEVKRIHFEELAAELGSVVEPRGNFTGTQGEIFLQDAQRYARIWPVDIARKMLDYLKPEADAGTPLEFISHPAAWAMLALVNELKKCPIGLYIPPLGRSVKLEAFTIGAPLHPDRIADFTVEEKGDNVCLTERLTNGGNPNPFAIPFSGNSAPAIVPGKNIYVRLEGYHYIGLFSLPWTYPDCRAMFLKMFDGTHCVISNTPEYTVGQIVPDPFE